MQSSCVLVIIKSKRDLVIVFVLVLGSWNCTWNISAYY